MREGSLLSRQGLGEYRGLYSTVEGGGDDEETTSKTTRETVAPVDVILDADQRHGGVGTA